MQFRAHARMLAVYGLVASFVVLGYARAIWGLRLDLALLIPSGCYVFATLLVGSSLELWSRLRRAPFLVGSAVSVLIYSLTFVTLYRPGDWAAEEATAFGVGLSGFTMLMPVLLPLGWFLVLVSRGHAHRWEARREGSPG